MPLLYICPMQNEQIQHAQEKVQWLKYASVNCHPSMKPYYQNQYAKWRLVLKKLNRPTPTI